MKHENLNTKLEKIGLQETSTLLRKIQSTDTLLDDVASILKDCSSYLKNIRDDLDILHHQLVSLTEFKDEVRHIIIRDLCSILEEGLNPSEELSLIYLDDQELEEVVSLYAEAMNGNLDKQLELAHFYKSISRDDWAFEWFQMAAAGEKADALYWLGNYYFVGEVVEHNLEKTYMYYKKAAELGHGDAMNNYADMYLRGEYVEKDEKRALELFRLAADKGVPEAMYTLGYMYANGVGTKMDLEVSRKWFVQSALAGDVFAANRLGHEAVEKGDGEEAISWYQMAADLGDSYGEFNLGQCYENGIGTGVNMKQAKYWYKRAALKGDQQAQQRLKEL
ncbi:tetratricopeptide repeat protein [Ornithinibacillus halotolerans]|uniref:Sel1 repeat family protein n=1 Tax=Ornithinibacillus halotolerans TaxID=1274357 RepID=A0A916W501_9BACI|nr:tetratricopeptide repeat protein [Ornithinibacillus halotolerans]GGA66561.1 hypothetical protein GCM10008025_08010 [Ornithinibacillus halotolerans]